MKHITTARRVIEQEGAALKVLATSIDASFDAVIDLMIQSRGKIVVSGIGKSGHIARKISATLASTGTQATFIHPAEASHGDLGMIDAEDIVLALSRSGEAQELRDIIGYCHRFAIPLVAVTAVSTSSLALAATQVLLLPDLAEATNAVSAPTTSTAMQLALGDAIAVTLLEARGFDSRSFSVIHPGGKLGAMLMTVGRLMHQGDQLPIVLRSADMKTAIPIITQKALGCAGVCDEAGRLIGIITDGDLRRNMEGLLDKCAQDVMSHAPVTVPVDALAADALRLMQNNGIAQVFVVGPKGMPLGIVHIQDMLRVGVI